MSKRTRTLIAIGAIELLLAGLWPWLAGTAAANPDRASPEAQKVIGETSAWHWVGSPASPSRCTWRARIWQDKKHASRISQPVLYVVGAESGPNFERAKQVFQSIVAHTAEVRLPGMNHLLMGRNPSLVARSIADFLTRHPFNEARCAYGLQHGASVRGWGLTSWG